MTQYSDVVWNKGDELMGSKKLTAMANNDSFFYEQIQKIPRGSKAKGSWNTTTGISTTPVSAGTRDFYLPDANHAYKLITYAGVAESTPATNHLTISIYFDGLLSYQINTQDGLAFATIDEIFYIYTSSLHFLSAGSHTLEYTYVTDNTSSTFNANSVSYNLVDIGQAVTSS